MRPLRNSGFTLLETLFVVALMGVISVIAVPMAANALANFRLTGDVRGAANAIALAKMRAASDFTRVRLYVDRSTKAHHLETFNQTTNQWTTEGGWTYLSTNTQFSFGAVATPPPNTQVAINQSPACKDSAGTAIANTSCVIFNSRGIPVDAAGNPFPTNALYLTDGTAVYGVTVAATGMIRLWRTQPVSTPAWVLQ
jgi:prepilin-type N-terminal cleavage/methylation domain-containing protein